MQDTGCPLYRPTPAQIARYVTRITLAAALTGLLASPFLLSQTARAEDSAGNAPKTLTLDQPSAEPGPECKPLDKDAALSPVQLKQTFADDFNEPKLQTDVWETHFPGPDNKMWNRTLPSNNEQQAYVDPEFANSGIDPFKLHDGMLSITVNKTPDNLGDKVKNLPYTSGLISSRHSFEQTFGYFETRARMPRGKALWPAFWMLRTQGGWPPEIDIMEVLNGSKPDNIFMTTHWKKEGLGAHQRTYCRLLVPDSDKAFHAYGVLWTEQRIVYYLDRKPIGQFATPAGLDHPMFLLANMAVQKNADDTTPMGATFDIDWIAAYEE